MVDQIQKRGRKYESSIRLDYLLHVIAYAGLAFLGKLGLKPKRQLLMILFLVAFAAATEAIQAALPYRAFNVVDLVSNVVGICVGWVVGFVFVRWMGG